MDKKWTFTTEDLNNRLFAYMKAKKKPLEMDTIMVLATIFMDPKDEEWSLNNTYTRLAIAQKEMLKEITEGGDA